MCVFHNCIHAFLCIRYDNSCSITSRWSVERLTAVSVDELVHGMDEYGFSAIFRTTFVARRPCTSRRGSRDSHSIRFAYTSLRGTWCIARADHSSLTDAPTFNFESFELFHSYFVGYLRARSFRNVTKMDSKDNFMKLRAVGRF